MSNGLQSVVNYMMPAVGSPRVFLISQVFDPLTPVYQDFRNVSGGAIDGQPFRPSGVLIDNTQGSDIITVRINEMSYQVVCPAGQTLNVPYPAPTEMTTTITGTGQATVVFCDYPVLPYRSF